MRIEAFRQWLSQADELTPAQPRRALEVLRQGLQPWDEVANGLDSAPACPRCHRRPCGRWGNAQGLPRFRCGVCGKPFNVLSGTALARLRHRECWGEYPQALIEGDTVGAAAQPLRCAQEHPLALAPAISRPSRRPQAVQPARQAWKRTKPTSCNPTRGSATCRARLARAGGWPTSAACPASRSR